MPPIPQHVRDALTAKAGKTPLAWDEPTVKGVPPPDPGPRPRILFLLQSQWFKDPARAHLLLTKYYQHEGGYWAGRARFARDMLFMGCKTGQVIDRYFQPVLGERGAYRVGEAGWGDVVFEETTPKTADNPRQVLPPDEGHVTGLLNYHAPRLVVAFGAVAGEALALPDPLRVLEALGAIVIRTCHPCARTDAPKRLTLAAEQVARWLKDNPR